MRLKNTKARGKAYNGDGCEETPLKMSSANAAVDFGDCVDVAAA
jgi:hypothetical protein